jgi:hypothetical protein
MARKVGFGDGRRSVLQRDSAPEPVAPEAPVEPAIAPNAPRRFDAGMLIGFFMMFLIPAIFAVIGAWPMLGALSFPERAHEVEAVVTGISSIQPPGEPARVTAIAVKYETRIGARLTANVATDEDREIGSTVVVFYDPDSPRYVRLSREVSFDEALDRVGDRIYFAYFALGFMALVAVMLVLVLAAGRKAGR